MSVIFMDGEFASLHPNGIDLISLALIKESGEELYLELEYDGELSSWVEEHVVPYLSGEKVSVEEAKKQIEEFVGDSKPVLVAYVNQFDWMGVCRLFEANSPEEMSKLPFHWFPIDFASILFAKEQTPLSLAAAARKYDIEISGVQHHALHDARLLKAVYEKVMK